MTILPLYFVFVSSFSLTTAVSNEQALLQASRDFGNTLFNAYRSLLKTQNENISSLSQKLLPNYYHYVQQNGSVAQCIADFNNLMRTNNTEKFAYIDAAGKPNSGLLLGNNLWLGSVAECRNISNAHFCLSSFSIAITPEFSIPQITWGACFPESCNDTGVYVLLKFIILPMVKPLTKADANLIGDICPPKPSYTKGVYVTLVLSGVVLFLCLIGTIIDVIIEMYNNCNEGATESSFPFLVENPSHNVGLASGPPQMSFEGQISGSRESITNLIPDGQNFRQPSALLQGIKTLLEILLGFVLCFSLVRNTRKIFDTNVPSVAITSINGIRVISICWVILGHTYIMFAFSTFTEDRSVLLENAKLLSKMPIINGYYSVDSFFFLSGLLVAYTCMRKLQKGGGRFNWVLFYVHRFLRLTPAYMYVILFSVYIKRFLADGPLYYQNYEDKACEKYWWTNLLYINNFHPVDLGQECIGWSWYLANDMQFFVIAPPLLYILYKIGWRGLFVPLALLGMSSIAIASIYGYYHLDPLANMEVTNASPKLNDMRGKLQKYVYIKPYCRVQPYLIGFILGYAMHVNFRRMQKPGWIVTMVGWAAAAATGMGLVYGPHKSTLPDARKWSEAENILYGTFDRLLWGLTLAWVTYACHYRAGGLIQKFLSAKFWIPLSRLTYSVYLIHLIILPVMFVGGLGTIHYDTYTVSYYYISAVVLSYGAGFILSVCIELPCDNLENLVIKWIRFMNKSRSGNVGACAEATKIIPRAN